MTCAFKVYHNQIILKAAKFKEQKEESKFWVQNFYHAALEPLGAMERLNEQFRQLNLVFENSYNKKMLFNIGTSTYISTQPHIINQLQFMDLLQKKYILDLLIQHQMNCFSYGQS